MDAPGGVVARPPTKVYDPTYWPVQSFVQIEDRGYGAGLALCTTLPGAVCCRPGEYLEAMALRNATRERAFRWLPLLANPAEGHERTPHRFDYGLWLMPAGDWSATRLASAARRVRDGFWDAWERTHLLESVAEAVALDPPSAQLVALKPASRGEGLIARLYAVDACGAAVELWLRHYRVERAFLCDARERDLESLQVRDGKVTLTLPGALATVRLLVSE
jgi:hypothetical protein